MRAKVEFSPKDVEQVDLFLEAAQQKNAAPLAKYYNKYVSMKAEQLKRDKNPFE